ncbi:hypothetical protein GUJ93_ZPchr0009g2350 [Zizania palustris]|uniref:Uncharacterized protein n=1 Tax=Zizania palustris TaxID=103762 RepID=A0A8J5RQM2_ZIZPA|nr:hypothetical protein GUJ93_ZPchr0009g2350 [Zizania palustris]
MKARRGRGNGMARARQGMVRARWGRGEGMARAWWGHGEDVARSDLATQCTSVENGEEKRTERRRSVAAGEGVEREVVGRS